jgi:putative spermidine/putrescine transport system permease protein
VTEPELTPTKPTTEGISGVEPAVPRDIALSEDTGAEIYGEEHGGGLALKAPPGASKLVTLLWMLPGALWLVIFLVAPVIVVLVVSFFTGTITGFSEVFTTSNYSAIFSGSSQYLSTLEGVARNSAIVTAVCLVIGYPVAYFLAVKVKKTQYAFGLFLIALAPFFTSTLIRAEAWIPTMSNNGAVNSILLFSNFAVIVALVQLLVLFMVTPIFFQLAQLDRSAIEAARDLGASGFRVFTHVTLPLTRAGIMIGCVFVFVLSMGDFATYKLVGGGSVGSIGLNIQNLVSLLNYPQAAAQAAILVVAMIVGVILLLRFAKLQERM